MKKLFEIADVYVEESTWVDFALVKLCLGAIGVLIGINLPKKSKKTATCVATGVFAATYVPLMAKMIRIVCRECK